MAIPWECTRKRRRQAQKTSSERAHLPRWVVPHRLTGEIYLISYKTSSGPWYLFRERVWDLPKASWKQLTRFSAFAATENSKTITVDLLLVCAHPRFQQRGEGVGFFGLWAIKRSFKHDLYFFQAPSTIREISPDNLFLWLPCDVTIGCGNKTDKTLCTKSEKMRLCYLDLVIMFKSLNKGSLWVSATVLFPHYLLFFLLCLNSSFNNLAHGWYSISVCTYNHHAR